MVAPSPYFSDSVNFLGVAYFDTHEEAYAYLEKNRIRLMEYELGKQEFYE